jgi:acyl-coenzyme A thioesterase PaaI-like protein
MSGFDDALHLEPQPDGRWRGHTHPAYANMVGPYGGITAAQALQAVLQQPGCLGDPLALTVNYAAALSDGPFTVQARAVRTNRSTQHWTVELSQGELVTTSATVVTAVRREAFVDAEHAMPAVPAPDRVPRVATAGMVAWLDRYEMRPL